METEGMNIWSESREWRYMEWRTSEWRFREEGPRTKAQGMKVQGLKIQGLKSMDWRFMDWRSMDWKSRDWRCEDWRCRGWRSKDWSSKNYINPKNRSPEISILGIKYHGVLANTYCMDDWLIFTVHLHINRQYCIYICIQYYVRYQAMFYYAYKTCTVVLI